MASGGHLLLRRALVGAIHCLASPLRCGHGSVDFTSFQQCGNGAQTQARGIEFIPNAMQFAVLRGISCLCIFVHCRMLLRIRRGTGQSGDSFSIINCGRARHLNWPFVKTGVSLPARNGQVCDAEYSSQNDSAGKTVGVDGISDLGERLPDEFAIGLLQSSE